MAKYVYPAVFTPEEDWEISRCLFPDLDGCYTCADDLQDAISGNGGGCACILSL